MTTREIEEQVRLAWPPLDADLRDRVLSAVALRTAELPAVDVHAAPTSERRAWSMPAWRTAPVVSIVASLFVMVAACGGWNLWLGNELGAEIARLEAKYGSLDKATLVVPAVPDANNRARIVRAAADLAVGIPGQRYFYLPFPMPSPFPENLRAFAGANSSAIQLLDGLRARTESNWDVNDRSRTDPPWNSLTTLSGAIYMTALLDIEAGRADDAARAIASALGMSASMRQEPSPFFQVFRVHMLWPRQVSAIRQLLGASAPSRPALEDLAFWLAENRKPDPMQVVLLAEMKGVNAAFARLENGDIDPGLVRTIYPETWPAWGSVFVRPAARIGEPFVRTARLRYLRHMERMLDAQMGPRPRPRVDEPAAPQPWEVIDRLVRRFSDGNWSLNDEGDDFASALGAAETAVALRRFKLDRGDYPPDLSALVPTYLDHLPIDPYTGRPPVYAQQGAGFRLRATASSWTLKNILVVEWEMGK